jgi:CheY-like chemotaxis protein/anti-sigma regulatory factor (Ser/Thr protein kinase)
VARDQAVEASRAKSQFLANVSHELRTPLNAIIGYSEILLEDVAASGESSISADLQRIRTAGKHLLTLINGILDLSKIEAGQMDVFLESVVLEELVSDVVDTIRPLVAQNGNELSIQLGKDLGVVRTDSTKLRQSLFNLLSNAGKFTHKGKVTLTVSRATQQGRDWIDLAVTDTGIGLTGEQISQLFVPFRQAEASTARKYGGTGLGLAISARFCRMLGGDIEVKSEPGKGSTFTIRIPADTDAFGPRDGARQTPSTGPLGVVVVIDDDPAARDMLGRLLGSAGFGVRAARDGEEGIKLAREVSPVAITLDVLMPKLDGWAILSKLHADPELRHVPVVMVSVVADRNMSLALGAADMLGKPVDRERLVSTLKKFARLPGHVLVVEDDVAYRDLIARTLTDEGCDVACAENGVAAMAQLEKKIPDLILLDLMMPEMDGFELVEHLQQNELWRKIPVVVATAKELTAADRARLAGSAQRVLQKGAKGDDVLDWLRRLVAAPADAGKHRRSLRP